MFRSSRFVSLVAMACIAAASAVSVGIGFAVETAKSAFAYAVSILAPSGAAPVKDLNQISLRVRFVMAKAFTARLSKRERPTVMERYRMCPSA